MLNSNPSNTRTASDADRHTPRQSITALEQALNEMTERVQRLTERAARLDKQLEGTAERVARGTGSVASLPLTDEPTRSLRKPRTAVATPAPVGDAASAQDIVIEIRRLIKERPRTFAELRELTQVRPNRIAGALIQIQRNGEAMQNLGTPRRAVWAFATTSPRPIGEAATVQQLIEEVRRLIIARPRTFAELKELTQVRAPRIAGALVQIQRNGEPLKNIGTARRAIWTFAKK